MALTKIPASMISGLLSTMVSFVSSVIGAVSRPAASKLDDDLTPEDVGAAGTGLVDDTAAVQRAINAWSLNRSRQIKLVGKYRIDGTLYVGNLETDNPETRLTFVGGGTLMKTNAGFMFDRPVGQALQTGHIYFIGTRFEGAGLLGLTFVLNGDNVIRTHFIGCFGIKINVAKANGYLQTIYGTNCVWRKWAGYMFDCTNLYDIQWHGVSEAGDGFLITRSASADPACNSLHISGDIEGLSGVSGPAIKIGVCYGSSISRLYCEGNAGGDIDASGGTGFHKGLTIQSCGFQPTAAQKANPNYYPVITGKGAADSLVLIGNVSTHNLFDVTSGNQSSVADMGNSVASGKKKFSPTSARVFSFSGTQFTASLLPGYGVSLDSYGGSYGFEGTRGTVGAESVCAVISVGTRSPQTFPTDYVQTAWKVGSYVHNGTPTIAARQYGAGVVHDALILGWKCMTSGSPGVWQEHSSMLPY